MAELDHWHPVLLSAKVGRAPVGVELAGRQLAIFRTASGGLGALTDRCPHRGMRLSEGWVEGERLVCGYHGWRWDAGGRAEVPATPTARPCAARDDVFDVTERYGAVWVKRSGSPAELPSLETDGRITHHVFHHRAAVPFELVLDNFSEVEHAPYVHRFMLGYSRLNRMPEVTPRVTLSDDAVQVVNVGPKRLPRSLARLLGVPADAQFTVEWTTRFSPVHSVYHHYFRDPRTAQPVGPSVRSAVFFNPVGHATSEIFTFLFATPALGRRFGLGTLLMPFLRAYMNRELNLDMRILARLADKRGSLKGKVLGRFDKAPLAARERIERLYRAQTEAALPFPSHTPVTRGA